MARGSALTVASAVNMTPQCPAPVAVVPCRGCYGIRTVVESPVAEIVKTPTADSAVYA